jgi:hypothetical protein
VVSIGDPLHGFLHRGRLFDGAELDLNLPSLFVKPDEFFQGALILVQIGEVEVPSFTNEPELPEEKRPSLARSVDGAIGERGWILDTQPASLPLPETKRSRDRPRERG